MQNGIRCNNSISCSPLNLQLFKKPSKSTVEVLLNCATGWAGKDMEELLKEVKENRTRSHL